MLEWFEPLDLVRSLDQQVVPATSTALETVEMIFEQMGYEESSRLGRAPSAAR
jgi:hypothetical protein